MGLYLLALIIGAIGGWVGAQGGRGGKTLPILAGLALAIILVPGFVWITPSQLDNYSDPAKKLAAVIGAAAGLISWLIFIIRTLRKHHGGD